MLSPSAAARSRHAGAFAAAHPHIGAVRSDHLDDRADVPDLAVLAVGLFERLHLRRHNLPYLGLIKRHLDASFTNRG